MSFLVKMFRGGEKVRQTPGQHEEADGAPGPEELLRDSKELLKRTIERELVFAKKNSRKNRRVALQAMRRKKWYEKHLKYIDCAIQATRSAHEHIDILNKVNDLITQITEKQDVTQDMSETLYTSTSCGVEFVEDELLAELEKLEKNLDESISEKDRVGKRVPFPGVLSTASHSHPEKTEEDEVEDELDYLWRWANEPS